MDDIASITTDPKLLEKPLERKTTIDFIPTDIETLYPQVILELKEPCRATILFGMERTYTRVALRMDEPGRFVGVLREHTSKRDTP